MPYDSNNIFARIIRKEIPATILHEDDETLAFADANPVAPVHILVIPKGDYCSYDDFVLQAQPQTIASFFQTVRKVALQAGLVDTGYRLIMNHGANASQTVHHFHIHIIGGTQCGGLLPNDKLYR